MAADSPLLQLPGMSGFRTQVDRALRHATAAEDELEQVRRRARFLTDSQIVDLCQRELESLLRG